MIKQFSKFFVSINDRGNRFSLNTNPQKQLLGTCKKHPVGGFPHFDGMMTHPMMGCVCLWRLLLLCSCCRVSSNVVLCAMLLLQSTFRLVHFVYNQSTEYTETICMHFICTNVLRHTICALYLCKVCSAQRIRIVDFSAHVALFVCVSYSATSRLCLQR